MARSSKRTKEDNKPQKPKNMRDDFTATTIRALKDSAGNICSDPGCRIFTAGSKLLRDGPISIGIAAHITAAAPGGPRYNESLTKEERRSTNNGIWLCQNHAREIDVDPTAFPVPLLMDWKIKAEQRANSMVGLKAITEDEHKEEVRKEVGLSLERFIRRDLNPIQTPLADVMLGYEKSLSMLDPRFNVKATAKNNVIYHEITAASADAKFGLVFKNTKLIEGFLESTKAFLEEGRELTVESPNFYFKGSQLFESIGSSVESGKITLAGKKTLLNTNIYAVDENGHEILICSFESHSTHGQKRLVAQGEGVNSFFKVKLTLDFETARNKIDLTFSLEGWKGKDILRLPYFSRLIKSLEYLKKGYFLVEFDVDGQLVKYNAKGSDSLKHFTESYSWLISTLQKARNIAERTDTPIYLKDLNFDEETENTIDKYNDLVQGAVKTKAKPTEICEATITLPDKYSFENIDAETRVEDLNFVESDGQEFNLFGQTIKAPKLIINVCPTASFLYCPVDTKEEVRASVVALEESIVTTTLSEGKFQIQ